jgi:hypothetical protein
MTERIYGHTAKGTPITDEMVERAAEEAERGFDVHEFIGQQPVGDSRLEADLRIDVLIRPLRDHEMRQSVGEGGQHCPRTPMAYHRGASGQQEGLGDVALGPCFAGKSPSIAGSLSSPTVMTTLTGSSASPSSTAARMLVSRLVTVPRVT